jgi:hypothetical protein
MWPLLKGEEIMSKKVNLDKTRYALLIEGVGNGCDYTIHCGRDFIVTPEGTTEVEAIAAAQEYFEEHSGDECIESIKLLTVTGVKELELVLPEQEEEDKPRGPTMRQLKQQLYETQKKLEEEKKTTAEVLSAVRELSGQDPEKLVDRSSPHTQNSSVGNVARNLVYDAVNKRVKKALEKPGG